MAVTLPDGASTPKSSPTVESPSATSQPRQDRHATTGQTDEPGHARQAARPIRVRIAAIDVNAPIGPLTVGHDRILPSPKKPGLTGWWQDGPEPGEPGPAVLIGHYDSDTGPAVFYRLAELSLGDRLAIDREDGTTVSFTVDGVVSYPQDAFPTDRVYGDTGNRPALRLITCGGTFDDESDRYSENLIVFATKTPPTKASRSVA